MIAEAVAAIRFQGGSWLRSALAGDEALNRTELATAADPGLFGPASIVWRVHGDSAMLIGGLRSLMIQTLHPLAMAGVAEHSDYTHDPWGRLNRTSRFIGATTYGSTEAAERAIAMVRTIHDRVIGTAPDGRPYSANDPHLLEWVHVTEVDSFLRAFDRFGEGKLRDAERDQYVAEMAEVGRRLGMVDPPITVAELDCRLISFRAECEYGPQAKQTVRFLISPPGVPFLAKGSYALLTWAAVSLLPGWAQRQMRLPVPPLIEPLAVRPAAKALTRVIGWFMQSDSSRSKVEDDLLT
ncbi:MAG: hypothetical protein ACI8TP_004797 [Acidimicrobiales bacterium]|jgi:uncharacterized protein (DUF2236 family)